MANVVPIFKKRDPSDTSNYRPISILSIFAKLFEALVCPVLSSHTNVQLASEQHGFRTRKSTSTNLVNYINDIAKSLDSRVQVDSIYTDFSSAFDKVNHKILLMKLKHFGIAGQLHRWFASYLTGRKQRVVVRGYESVLYSSTSGVPQGSHLGPILFLIFVNDIICSIKHSKCSMFADDLKLYREIRTDLDVSLLQKDLDAIHEWCRLNMMTLNVSKCYHVTFTRNKKSIPSSYEINGVSLQKVDTIRDLGVRLDSKLSFIPHIDLIVSKATKMAGFVKRTCSEFRSVSTLKLLFNTLVRSILDYASPAWNPTYRVHIDRIERIQKAFTRYLRFRSASCEQDTSYSERLNHFNMISLEQRRSHSDQIFLYKIIHNRSDVPELLSELNISVPRRTITRSIRKSDILAMSPSRTNLGRSAPMNRLMANYNKINYNSTIDIFADTFYQFRKKLMLPTHS